MKIIPVKLLIGNLENVESIRVINTYRRQVTTEAKKLHSAHSDCVFSLKMPFFLKSFTHDVMNSYVCLEFMKTFKMLTQPERRTRSLCIVTIYRANIVACKHINI